MLLRFISSLTQKIHSKPMSLDVIKQGREDGQQGHSDVVDALADALHLGTRLHEFAQLEHLHQLLQVLGCVLEESPEAGFDKLRSGLHDCSERAERTRELRMAAGRHFLSDGSPCTRKTESVGLPGVE